MDVYDTYDVVVIGHGLGGLSAGLSTRELGAETVVLEKAALEEAGGNTQYTIGLRTVLTELDSDEYDTDRIENAVPYGEDEFDEDMMRMSDGLADEELDRAGRALQGDDRLAQRPRPQVDGRDVPAVLPGHRGARGAEGKHPPAAERGCGHRTAHTGDTTPLDVLFSGLACIDECITRLLED